MTSSGSVSSGVTGVTAPGTAAGTHAAPDHTLRTGSIPDVSSHNAKAVAAGFAGCETDDTARATAFSPTAFQSAPSYALSTSSDVSYQSPPAIAPPGSVFDTSTAVPPAPPVLTHADPSKTCSALSLARIQKSPTSRPPVGAVAVNVTRRPDGTQSVPS